MVRDLYNTNELLRNDLRFETGRVIKGSGREIPDTDSSIDTAVHYIISEFAFMEWVAQYLDADTASFIYHVNWPSLESYIAGKYDHIAREHMDFMLLKYTDEPSS